ncbi:MAG: hypothetical protein ACREM8_00535 [Vulcanimicrobiaceae bacterium]
MSGSKSERDAWLAGVRQAILLDGRRDREIALSLSEKEAAAKGERWAGIRQNFLDSAPLDRELGAMFPGIQSFDELPSLRINYAHVLPKLLYWLARINNEDVTAGLSRVIAGISPASPLAAPAIVHEFRKIVRADPNKRRWMTVQGMAQSIVRASTDAFVDELADLAADESLTSVSRIWLAQNLAKRRDPRAIAVNERFLSDPEEWIAERALKSLRILKPIALRDRIAALQKEPPSKDVRVAAEKVIIAIDKAKDKPPTPKPKSRSARPTSDHS